jgi:superfamily I DNA/RNA helicase
MMVEIVREYDNEIYDIIKLLKKLHTGDEEKDKAEMIFSTVHRAKGMEYDIVYLVNDFISETKLIELKEKHKSNKTAPFDIDKLNEDINLLYVAITRTRRDLYIPDDLVPEAFQSSPHIHIEYEAQEKQIIKPPQEKKYTVSQKREQHKDSYKPWTTELDNELKELYEDGWSVGDLTTHFKRTKGAILSRLKKLNFFLD